MKKIALATLAMSVLSASSAAAQSVSWGDWDAPGGSSATWPAVPSPIPFTYWSSTTGSISLPNGGSIAATLTGEIMSRSCINSVGSCGDPWATQPAGTYTSTNVPNFPASNEQIAQTGYVTTLTGHTLSFTQPVTNLVMAVWSLGDGGARTESAYQFDQDFIILSQSSNCDPATNITETGLNCLRKVGKTLYGKEGNGTIQFLGKYSSISWTVTVAEFYSAFTVGVTTAPNPENALLALQSGANNLVNVLGNESAAIARSLDYDCRKFGQNNWCISGGARYSRLESGNMSSGAGILIASYQPVEKARLGVFIDYAPSNADPSGFDSSNMSPTWGGFVGYGNNDGSGLQVKASAAAKMMKLKQTRDASLLFTEPGQGTADVRAAGFQMTAAYGFAISDNFLLSPFIGYRVGSVSRGTYNEDSSESVTAPFQFDRFNITERTLLSGVRAQLALNDRFALQVSTGLEKTLSSSVSKLSGSTPLYGMSNFSVDAPRRKSGARFAAEAGASYMVTKGNWISATASYRELSFNNKKDLTVRAMFTSAF